jgi:alpha-mannosidase
MQQNFYPPYEALKEGDFQDGLSLFAVTSEEMLPPEYIQDLISKWGKEHPEIQYIWGTQRHLAPLLEADLALVDAPPPERLSSAVENNPAQTGCMVTLIKSKMGARRSEALFYGAEVAVAAANFSAGLCRSNIEQWHELFSELCLYHFHDAVTGTHQEVAGCELRERRKNFESAVNGLGAAMVSGRSPSQISALPGPDKTIRVFNPRAEANDALRIELPLADWHEASPMIAETDDGRRFPVTMPWHSFSPEAPVMKFPIIHAVGSAARTRPENGSVFIEVPGLEPLSWTSMTLRNAASPHEMETRELSNGRIRIMLGDKGVDQVCDLETGAVMRGEEAFPIGALRLDEDEGDPWGTRKIPAFRDTLASYTKFLGAARFEGYSEAWYYGIYEPNLGFGREKDAMVFGLEWQITVRLLDGAERVDFCYEIFWKSANRRIRVVFPTQSPTDTGWYSIPGGWLGRKRYEQTGTGLWSPNGDWPALYFVATQGSDAMSPGWALVNYGTPSARIENGQIQMSLLRSPAFGHCLERYGQNYPMPTGNLRDSGWHHFTFSLTPHAGAGDMANLTRRAAALNARPFSLADCPGSLPDAAWPKLISDSITLEAVKPVFLPSPKGIPDNAVVLRFLNLSAQSGQATLRQDAALDVMLQECNLIEEPEGEIFELKKGRSKTLNFEPFKSRSFISWSKQEEDKL